MAAHRDAALDRAATRWVARLVLERASVRLDDLRLAVAALEALPERPAAARAMLADLCARHRLAGVMGLVDGGGGER